ncbi:MAG: hypothetical protein ACRD0U_14050 [Acidimicrobiales bacterium]
MGGRITTSGSTPSKAGITEAILARWRSAGLNPYDWCADALDDREGVVIDVACGSAR